MLPPASFSPLTWAFARFGAVAVTTGAMPARPRPQHTEDGVMVGIYSLFALGVAAGGPAYVWLTWVPVIGMLFVALVFGEMASHYPVAGALYQVSKFCADRCRTARPGEACGDVR